MSEKISTSLDNPVFAGRLRIPAPAPRQAAQPKPQQELSYRTWLDISTPSPKPVSAVKDPVAPTKVPAPKQAIEATFERIEIVAPKKLETTHSPDFVKNAEAWREKAIKQKLTKEKLTSWLLFAMAGLLFVFGSYVALNAFMINKKFQGPANAQGVTPAADRDENQPSPDDIMNYNVSPEMPRFIRIAKFNSTSRVLNMGIDNDGRMATPSNIFDAGWYNQSALPGAGAGAAVIGGHVSGPTKGGIFEHLDQLVAGDEVEIERGNGQKVTYEVVSSESKPLDKVDMQKAMNSIQPGKAGLTLITCTGALDDSGHHYKDRLLVYAVEK